jgi:large subunit ribosomal protein L25
VKTDIVVAAEVRTSRGKNEARRTRREGKIPAVVYGAFQDPVSVAVSPREILKIVHSKTGYNTIFNLALDDEAPARHGSGAYQRRA